MADGREKQRVVAAAAEAAAAAVLLLLLSSMTTKMREPSFKLSPSSFPVGFLVQVKSSQVLLTVPVKRDTEKISAAASL